jgi:hypothetical protein
MGLFGGKLKNLFQKKEGGTLIGNVLRKVGDTVTGGVYSNLFPKPTASDIAKASGSLPEIGMSTIPDSQRRSAPMEKALSVEVNAGEETSITKKGWFFPVVIGVPLAVIGLIVALVKRKK